MATRYEGCTPLPFSILDAAHAMFAKKGGDALGIYELDGDNLKVACVVGTWAGKEWRGKPRPTQFRLPDAEVVIELRRAKGSQRQARASAVKEERKDMTVKRMDNVLIVVDDLEAAKAFFIELGLKLEGETTVEGAFGRETDRAQGCFRATLAMMRTSDGQGDGAG